MVFQNAIGKNAHHNILRSYYLCKKLANKWKKDEKKWGQQQQQ